jgi:dTDP-4-amino-4,6-dideoxygalactose transaminase
VYHLYVVRHPRRSAVVHALRDHGIGFGLHYPVPIHRSAAYAFLGLGPGSYPNAELLAEEILSLPMYPELTVAHIEQVCEVMTATSLSG